MHLFWEYLRNPLHKEDFAQKSSGLTTDPIQEMIEQNAVKLYEFLVQPNWSNRIKGRQFRMKASKNLCYPLKRTSITIVLVQKQALR